MAENEEDDSIDLNDTPHFVVYDNPNGDIGISGMGSNGATTMDDATAFLVEAMMRRPVLAALLNNAVSCAMVGSAGVREQIKKYTK